MDTLLDSENVMIVIHLAAAWVAGSLIGLERSFHGRPAGFRTHALVCVSSALLSLVMTYQWQWLGNDVPVETIRTDPTRVAQGIMTGIGFLGAGVILKEGLSVRGLTTAASIWMTASIGILYGVGFWFPAVLSTIVTLITLALFRQIEAHMHSQVFATHTLRFPNQQVPDEAFVRTLMAEHDFKIMSMSYHMSHSSETFEYQMMLRTYHRDNLTRLSKRLITLEGLAGFRLAPVSG
ncbi:MgtC/SapB family protein [Phytohalomonas tamaricis]|uniref:MgtC/SapB family protein n=1 Tax=Phytohalomonas tamaricis TaxID=2081032 RepID=UPI000D0B284B|nr:MgtC/SapB family protein [Phytohalomonas tamaricis]